MILYNQCLLGHCYLCPVHFLVNSIYYKLNTVVFVPCESLCRSYYWQNNVDFVELLMQHP